MDLVDSLNQLHDDPDFGKLSYGDQLLTRSIVFKNALASDPSLQGLSQTAVDQLYKGSVYRPPVLQDKGLQDAVGVMSAGRDSNDPTQQARYDMTYSTLKETLDSGLLLGLGSHLGAALLPGDLNDPNPRAQGINLAKALTRSGDDLKVFEWLNAREALGQPGVSPDYKTGGDVESVIGNIADFASPSGPGAMVFKAVQNAPKVVAAIDAATTVGGRLFWRTLVPAAAEGVIAGGTSGVLRDAAVAALNRDPDSSPFNDAGHLVTSYGMGVAGDLIGGLVTREILPHVIAGVKGVFGKGLPGTVTKGGALDEQGLQNNLQSILGSEGVAPETKAMLGPLQDAIVADRANTLRIAQQGMTQEGRAALTDEDRLILGTHLATPDMVIKPTGGGGYDIYHIAPSDQGHTVNQVMRAQAETLPDAFDVVAGVVSERGNLSRLKADPELDARITKYAPWVYQWQSAGRAGADALEASLPAAVGKRIGVADRPYVGENEVAQAQGQIPVKLEIDNTKLDRVKAGKAPLDYGDLGPATPNPENANAVILTKKVLPIPGNEYNQEAAIQARAAGYDTLALQDGAGHTTGYVPLSPHNVKLVVPEVGPEGLPKLSKTTPRVNVGEPSEKATISQKINSTVSLSNLSDNPRLLSQVGAKALSDDVSPDLLETYVRGLSNNREIPVMISHGPEVSAQAVNGELHVTVPARTASPAEALDVQRKLTQAVGTLPPEVLKGARTAPQRVLNELQGIANPERDPMFKLLGKSGVAGEQWLGNVVQKELGAELQPLGGGRYRVDLGNGPREGSLSDVYQGVKAYLVKPAAIRSSLRDAGYTLTENSQGVTLVAPGGAKTFYSTLAAAADAVGVDTLHLPVAYRPTFVEIDPVANSVRLYSESSTVVLGKQDAMRLLNSFETGSGAPRAVRGKDGLTFLSNEPTEISVKVGNSQAKLLFPDLQSALKFQSEELGTWQGLQTIAHSKGLDVRYEDGGYSVRTQGADTGALRAASKAEVETIMASYPTKEFDATEMFPGAKDIMDAFPPEILRQWKAFARDFQPLRTDIVTDFSTWSPQVADSFRQGLANATATFQYARGRLNREGLIPKELDSKLEQMIRANEAQQVEWTKASNTLLKIFSVRGKGEGMVRYEGAGSHPLPRDRRRLITQYMGAQTSEELEALQRDFPLNMAEQGIVKDLRDFYGVRGETGLTGLANKFGLSLQQYQGQYISRIAKFLREDPEAMTALRKASTSSDFLSYLERSGRFDPNAVREMRLWFENARKQDFHSSLFEDDALSISLQYTRAGLRKFWMNIPEQEYLSTFSQFEGVMGQQAKDVLTRFHDTITGKDLDTWGTHAVAGMGRAVMGTLGKVLGAVADTPMGKLIGMDAKRYRDPAFAQRGEKLLGNFLTLQYVSFLGMRPMTAIRNVAQIYPMFGAAYGLDYLDDAVKWMSRAPHDQIEGMVKKLIQTDTLTSLHPYLDEAAGSLGLQKFANFSLKWFKNADDYTRFIGYTAATFRFGDAVKKLANGVWGEGQAARDGFMKYSRLALFEKTNPTLTENIWSRVQGVDRLTAARINGEKLFMGSPELAEAAHLYAKQSVDFTLFNYNSWNKPMMFSKGLFGKLFGQLGMFAASYRNYISQAMTNLKGADLASFMTGFLGINLAFFTAFKAAQIKTNDFIPFLPGLGGMGPSMEVFMDAMNASKDAQARGRLAREFSPILVNKGPVGVTPPPGVEGYYPAEATGWNVKGNFPSFVPGAMQTHFVGEALKWADKGDWYKALLSLSTASVESDWQDDLPIGVAPLQVKVPQANPPTLVSNVLHSVTPQRVAPPTPKLQ